MINGAVSPLHRSQADHILSGNDIFKNVVAIPNKWHEACLVFID